MVAAIKGLQTAMAALGAGQVATLGAGQVALAQRFNDAGWFLDGVFEIFLHPPFLGSQSNGGTSSTCRQNKTKREYKFLTRNVFPCSCSADRPRHPSLLYCGLDGSFFPMCLHVF